jgi:hypothetical protein
MRAADLDPGPRRLLRRAGRVDPNPTKIEPRDEQDAEALLVTGLVDVVPMFGGNMRGAKITPDGREALR